MGDDDLEAMNSDSESTYRPDMGDFRDEQAPEDADPGQRADEAYHNFDPMANAGTPVFPTRYDDPMANAGTPLRNSLRRAIGLGVPALRGFEESDIDALDDATAASLWASVERSMANPRPPPMPMAMAMAGAVNPYAGTQVFPTRYDDPMHTRPSHRPTPAYNHARRVLTEYIDECRRQGIELPDGLQGMTTRLFVEDSDGFIESLIEHLPSTVQRLIRGNVVDYDIHEHIRWHLRDLEYRRQIDGQAPIFPAPHTLTATESLARAAMNYTELEQLVVDAGRAMGRTYGGQPMHVPVSARIADPTLGAEVPPWIDQALAPADRIIFDENIDQLGGTMEQTTARTARTSTAPFSAVAYATRMTEMMSLNRQILTDKAELIAQAPDQAAVNKLLFDGTSLVAEPAKELTITEEMAQLFKTVAAPNNSGAVLTAERNAIDSYNRATQLFTDAQNRLVQARSHQLDANRLKNLPAPDLTKEIQKIVSDGWYTFEPEITKEKNANEGRNGRTAGLWFSTNAVTLSHIKPTAGIHCVVDMGRYLVGYWPNESRIAVLKHKHNVLADSYYHPHVSTGGDVCWGNGSDRMVQAMRLVQPSIAFEILRVILTTYNEASPYQDLERFATGIDPRLRWPGVVCDFQVYGSRAVWIADHNAPNDLDENYVTNNMSEGDEDDMGHRFDDDSVQIRPFRLMTPEGARVAGSPYFARLDNGRFVALNESRFLHWETV